MVMISTRLLRLLLAGVLALPLLVVRADANGPGNCSCSGCTISCPNGGCSCDCDDKTCVCTCLDLAGQRNMCLTFTGVASDLLKSPTARPVLGNALSPQTINVLQTCTKPIAIKVHNQPAGAVAAELARQCGVPAR